MRRPVYVETTIVSYLVGWLNRNDLQVAAHQELTRRWWTTRRDEFELYASAAVIDEASDGDPILAAERLQFLKALPLLRVTREALDLCRAEGYEPPLVCTPHELLGENDEEQI